MTNQVTQEYELQIRKLIHETASLKSQIESLQRKLDRASNPPIKGTNARKLRAALIRCVHGRADHEYNCSAARGSPRDCTCGWTEIKAMVSG